jgi:hypothetical protein
MLHFAEKYTVTSSLIIKASKPFPGPSKMHVGVYGRRHYPYMMRIIVSEMALRNLVVAKQ